MNQQNRKRRAFKAAFPHTIPILAGFLFLGMTYGIYMNVSGFSFVYPMVMSLVIYGGPWSSWLYPCSLAGLRLCRPL